MSNPEVLNITGDSVSGNTSVENSSEIQDSFMDTGFPDLVDEGIISLIGKHDGIMEDWLYDLFTDESVC